MAFSFEEEVQANKLNGEKLSRLYKELILPRLSLAQMADETIAVNNGKQGAASREMKTPNGFRLPMSAEVYPTGNGVRSAVLLPLYYSWLIEYFNSHDERFSLEARNRAVLAGLQKDAPRLREIGITHLTNLDIIGGNVQMMEIGEMEKGYERWVANPSLKPAP